MLARKIVAVVLGTALTMFGRFIFFQKKYCLIHGFEADLKAGRKNEAYAGRVGLVECVFGIGMLIAGVARIASA